MESGGRLLVMVIILAHVMWHARVAWYGIFGYITHSRERNHSRCHATSLNLWPESGCGAGSTVLHCTALYCPTLREPRLYTVLPHAF